jgi:hypothetical protein
MKFNLDTYRKMLDIAMEHWPFVSYREIETKERFIVWRHDCDMSLNRALSIAEIDKTAGAKSTFFIYPRSEYYNVLESSQTKLLLEIANLGHEIGVHVDLSCHGEVETDAELISSIENDARIVEDILQNEIKVFSFHNPNTMTSQFRRPTYGRFINCYSQWIFDNIEYCSDSNGYWRHRPIPELLENRELQRIQVLTHPEWWIEQDVPPRDRVLRAVYGRAVRLMNQYDAQMSVQSNRENVGSSSRQLDEEVAIAQQLIFGETVPDEIR